MFLLSFRPSPSKEQLIKYVTGNMLLLGVRVCVCVRIYNWNFLQFLLDGNLRCPVGFIRERAIYHRGAHLPCMLSHFSHVQLFATLWNVAHQAPLSMGFSRQESWRGLPFPPLGDLSEPRIEPTLAPAMQADSLPLVSPWKTGACVGHCWKQIAAFAQPGMTSLQPQECQNVDVILLERSLRKTEDPSYSRQDTPCLCRKPRHRAPSLVPMTLSVSL